MGRTATVGGERQERHHRHRACPALGEPAVMQQFGVEPAEGCPRSQEPIGPRRDRQGPRTHVRSVTIGTSGGASMRSGSTVTPVPRLT
jgi:hypothetical protein